MAENLLVSGVVIATGGRAGVQEISGITASLVENGFSRDQEREADWLGIDYMVKAGYNPEGAVQLQEYFYRQLEGGKNPMWAEGSSDPPFLEGTARQRPREDRGAVPRRGQEPELHPQRGLISQGKTARLRDVQKAYDVSDAGTSCSSRSGTTRRWPSTGSGADAARARPRSTPRRVVLYMVQKNSGAAEVEFRKAIALDGELFEPRFCWGAQVPEPEYRAAIPELERSMDL